ncbi:hypothetical protein SAMN04488082_101372 [Desulfomicrobium apsheronum]|uniref:Uncharacterized protein n=1 Tax=Desulfomicrobium apsheronum TaxID=52560 RepID=A0A1I3NRX6_9BACT|nr:hypothetical protein [Desulfomicrobium apsheronum]SFJ12033.1 hypothetical protein SAMN04488082_101372 [Desulfomicrobium apsheronum]
MSTSQEERDGNTAHTEFRKKALEAQWPELCRRCNELRLDPRSWWARIIGDVEAVPRVDETGITVRLRGNVFAEVCLHGPALQCRIAPEHLLLSHPGSMAVLGDAEALPRQRRVECLADLARFHERVRRRVCRHEDRRAAILDRLFLRHSCVLGVDAVLPSGRADLVVLSPRGTVVFFLLRRYQDGDLRLAGRGGIVWRMHELGRLLADKEVMDSWFHDFLERSRALETPHLKRYRFAGNPVIHPRARLLIVDFDHAQRLGGLPSLRADLETGLDQGAIRDDIHCIGDAGNISYTTLFSGI